eukprot:3276996-Prymnesium_polylepis.1
MARGPSGGAPAAEDGSFRRLGGDEAARLRREEIMAERCAAAPAPERTHARTPPRTPRRRRRPRA